MFIGEFKHNIDEKGRLALPAKFRAKLAAGVVITKGLDKALVIYTKEEWEKIAGKLADLPYTQANARAFSRLMLAGASDCEMDRQGRINIPMHLREFAEVRGNAMVVGVHSRIEIWNTAKWNEYKAGIEGDSNEIAEKLDLLGM